MPGGFGSVQGGGLIGTEIHSKEFSTDRTNFALNVNSPVKGTFARDITGVLPERFPEPSNHWGMGSNGTGLRV